MGGCLCCDVVRYVCVCVRGCVCGWSGVLSELGSVGYSVFFGV